MTRFIAGLLIWSAVAAAPCGAAPVAWKVLKPGVEYAAIPIASGQPLHVVRVDPARATLVAATASETGTEPQTAGQWCRASHLSVAINLGMFNADHRTHTGYLRTGRHVNSAEWNAYKSVLAVRPRSAQWFDLEGSIPVTTLDQYEIVVQNLRLIARPGKNVWAANDRKWSEAALAIDSSHRLLFIFSRAPYTMRDFNALLLSLPLGIESAMHLEGGPEASLSVHVGSFNLDLCGSYETGFMENDRNGVQWPIPNVLGVR